MIYNNIELSVHDLLIEALSVADAHINGGEKPLDNISAEMRDMAEFQFAIQYYIENSDWDWRTKAEAYLRSQYMSDFAYADDETLIYLVNKSAGGNNYYELKDLDFKFVEFDIQHDIHAKALKKSHVRWDEYKFRWDVLGFSDENPFLRKSNISNLRLVDFESDFLDVLLYNSESQHLLSLDNIRKFNKLVSLFRTGMNNIIVKIKCAHIYHEVKAYLSTSEYLFGYNYTVSDKAYLLALVHQFINGRLASVTKDGEFYSTRNLLLVDPWKLNLSKMNWSTVDYTKAKPPLSLICLNMHAVWFSKPNDYLSYIDDTSQRIIKYQSKYGYWFDSTNNPESTTVLALDALNIKSEELSFPLSRIRFPKDVSEKNRAYVEYNADTRILTVGKQQIYLSKAQWGLFEELVNAKRDRVPVKVKPELKNAVDYLRKKLMNKDHLKDIIKISKFGKNMGIYQISPNVHIEGHGFAWSTTRYELSEQATYDEEPDLD